MGDKTGIQWTDATCNPIRGKQGRHHCTKVSPACKNCYAERMNLRFSGLPYVAGADSFRLDEEALLQPLKWRRGRRIFLCSMTDLFHEELRPALIDRVFAMMALAPRHTFQILTKRPAMMLAYLTSLDVFDRIDDAAGQLDACHANLDGRWPLPNVWLGITAESQGYANERIPLLLQTPAAVRFVSYEPALGPVDFTAIREPLMTINALGGFVSEVDEVPEGAEVAGPDLWDKTAKIDWLICGGESGPKARPMHPDWARSARDQCQAAGVPFFFKQWGQFVPPEGRPIIEAKKWQLVDEQGHVLPRHSPLAMGRIMAKVGKKAAGRLLDGREWNEFPKGAA